MSYYQDALELREQRGKLWDENKALLDKAQKENRDLDTEEQQEWDKRDKEMDALESRIARLEKAYKTEAQAEKRMSRALEDQEEKEERTGQKQNRNFVDPNWQRRAINAWALGEMDEEQAEFIKPHVSDRKGNEVRFQLPSYKEVRNSYLKNGEVRDLSAGTATKGEETVPEGFIARWEEALLAFGGMRTARTDVIRTATGNDVLIPTVNDTTVVGEIVGENADVGASVDPAFAEVLLESYKYSSKPVLVSMELLQDSAFDLAARLSMLLGNRVGRIQNQHFTTGTGTGQPNGFVTAALAGGATVSAAGAAAIAYADLVDLIHGLDPAYRPNAQLMLHDSILAEIRKLVDGNNLPLWGPGMAFGAPNTILGIPYVINQDMDAAPIAAGKETVAYGDFSKYVIRDATGITLSRTDDRYWEKQQVGFLVTMRSDGDLLDAGTDPIKLLQH